MFSTLPVGLRAAQPIMRLAQLWTDSQQTGISVQRLGNILNAPVETAGAKSSLPQIAGRITFDQVRFRYRPDTPGVLKGIGLDIQPRNSALRLTFW